MGQYHFTVNMDRTEYLNPHNIGCGLKAWEQTGGGVPAALALLLSADPGNEPADLGHHPMTGRWAGERLLVVGDYAENGDIPRFKGPPLKRIYGLCHEAPKLEDFKDVVSWRVPGSNSSWGENYRYLAPRNAKRHVLTAKAQYEAALRAQSRITMNGKYPLFTNISSAIIGGLEYAASIRFCGDGWLTPVPVKPFAERGKDGHPHYRIADSVARNQDEWNMILRLCNLGGWEKSPKRNSSDEKYDGNPWPWDRPPRDLSWHDATDADQDMGRFRVWVNLDKGEYFDPQAFGEVPTTLGVMRAAYDDKPRMAIDMMVTSAGVSSNVLTGKPQCGSAAALFAMLLHPEWRGGGDICSEDFPLIGRWRNNRVALHTRLNLPAGLTDISAEIVRAACSLESA
jgi:hypothetical protein